MPTLTRTERGIRSTLYRQLRRNGVKVLFRHLNGQNVDWKTLSNQVEYKAAQLRRALIFTPKKGQRDFVYDLTYIAGGKNFTEGGYFDTDIVQIMVLNKDLGGLEVCVGDNLVFEGMDKQYEIDKKTGYQRVATLFMAKAVEGAEVEYAG